MADFRVGTGFDAHALEPGVPLVLGGVSFRGPRGLAGHSDGDVITHALIDALLGAAGIGDIGTLFPSDASTPEGISSLDLLRDAVARVRAEGYEFVNASCVLIGQEPRLINRRTKMETVLSEITGGSVAVSATTTDELGFTGRNEGLAAQAVALLSR